MNLRFLASDADLVRGARAGEPGAFEELVQRHQKKAQAVAIASGVRPQGIEDVLQASFLRAFGELDRLRTPESFAGWFLAIVRNEAREQLRAARRTPSESIPLDLAAPDAEALDGRDLREFVWRKVGELPEGVREAVLLYYHEGESVRAVARALGVTVSAVKNRLMLGRDLLRGRLWREMEKAFHELVPSRWEWRRRGRRLAWIAMMSAPGTLSAPSQAAAALASSHGGARPLPTCLQGVWIMSAKKTAASVALLFLIAASGGMWFFASRYLKESGEVVPRPAIIQRTEEGSTPVALGPEESRPAEAEVQILGPLSGASGQVVYEETGAPAAGSRVAALRDGEMEYATRTITGDDGRYRLTGLPPGRYTVLAWKDGWATDEPQASDPIEISAGKLTERADRTLVSGGVLTGMVVEEGTDRAIEGAFLAVDRRLFARTGAGGGFRVDGVPPGTAALLVSASGHAARGIDTVIEPGAEPSLRIALEAGGVVEGTVRDADGAPAAGVVVERLASRGGSSAQADRDGRYCLEGVPLLERELTLHVGSGSTLQTTISVEGFSEGSSRIRRDIDLPGEFTLEGKVVDAGGAPMAGAEFFLDASSLERRSRRPESTSRNDGTFRITCANDHHEVLTARRRGFAPSSLKLRRLAPEERSRIEFVLDPGRELAGVVVDAGGGPIPHAWVYAMEGQKHAGPYPSTLSDSGGRFRLKGLAAKLKEVGAVKRGYLDGRTNEALDGGEEVRVVMEEAGTILGEVMEAEGGAPVARFTVKVTHGTRRPAAGEPRTPLPASYRGDGLQFGSGQGRFTVDRLASGDRFDLTVVADGYVERILSNVEAKPPSERSEPLRVELKRGEEIRGRVVDSKGEPIVAAKVAHFNGTDVGGGGMMGGGGTMLSDRRRLGEVGAVRETATDDNGSFRIRGVSAGPGALLLEKRGFARTVITPLIPTGELLEIQLDAGAVLEGSVRGAAGEPVPGASVRLRLGDLVLPGAVTGEDGRYAVCDLSAGEVTVEMAVAGKTSRRAAAQLRAGERTVLDFVGSAGSIAGRVTRNGEPVAGAELSLIGLRSDLGGGRAVAGAAGEFRFENLEPGRYRVEAFRSGLRRPFLAGARREIEVGQGEVRCDLQIATGALAGRVIDSVTGQPVPAAEVQLHVWAAGGPSDEGGRTVLGGWAQSASQRLPAGESRFRFDDLSPGKYFVVAVRDSGEGSSGFLGPLETSQGPWSEDLAIVLGGPGRVDVEVVEASGGPLPDSTSVWVRRADGFPFTVGAELDGSGRAVIRGLPCGPYRLDAESDIHNPAREVIEVGEVALARTLRLDRAAWIRLSFEGPNAAKRVGFVTAVALDGGDPGWHHWTAEGNRPAEISAGDLSTPNASLSFKTRPGRYRIRFEISARGAFVFDPLLSVQEVEVFVPIGGEAVLTLSIP